MLYKNIYKTLQKTLDLWIPWRIKYSQVPGVTILVSHKGKTIYDSAFGYKNIEKKEKMTPDTLFRVASMSKMFTAVSIMQLVEKDKISLESNISKYLKKFEDHNLKDITIRNLLSHQGGVFRDSDKNYWEENKFTSSVLSDVSNKTKVIPQLKHFKYSNFGFSILGKVIEAVSGQPYNKYVRKNIIEKIGLKNTYPDYTEDLERRLSLGYSRHIPGNKTYSFKHSKTLEYSPATGFISNTKDLALFLHDISSKKSKLLSENLRKELTHPYSKIDDVNYGLGFEIEFIDNKKVYGHSGGFPGFITVSMMVPDEDLSVVVLTNSLNGPPNNIASSAIQMFFWLSHLKFEKNKLNISKYEGVYQDSWGETCIVGFGNKLISINAQQRLLPGNGKTYLLHQNKDEFKIKTKSLFGSPDETVLFKDFKNGKAQTMIWAGGKSKRIQ